MKNINFATLKKYRILLALIGAFFALIMILSSLTYVMSNRIAQATSELDLSASQTALVQQLSKNLFDINLYLDSVEHQHNDMATEPTAEKLAANNINDKQIPIAELPQSAIYQLEEITEQYQTFNRNLEAFKKGSNIKTDTGEIEIIASQDPKQIETLQRITTIWTPYQGLLENFIEDNKKGMLSKNTSEYLMDYTRIYNLSLNNETKEYTNHLNQHIQQQTEQLRSIQIVGVILAFLLLLAIIFGALRRLLFTDNQLAVARQQTDDIMKTVNDGLMLIDRDLVIADEYSKNTELILNRWDLGGKTLLDLLEGVISEKDMKATQLFVEQLYNPWVVEELIADLNPLKKVQLSSVDKEGKFQHKFLDFNFLRVMHNDSEEIDKVFVSVVDITEAVRLQAVLDKQKQQHDYELEMISSILTVDSRNLLNFIDSTKKRIEKINDVLKLNIDVNTENLRTKARELFRHMHSLKGDASALKLNAFVGIAQKQEDKLKELIDRSALKGDDFLPFTVGLNELLDLVNYIESLLERLKMMGGAINQNTTTASDKERWKKYFVDYANDIAQRHDKKVQLNVSGFDEIGENAPNFGVYRDIAVQFLKNAIVHGIELPSERVQKGKDEVGQIALTLSNIDNGLRLAVQDDGKGIDVERIRQKAIDLGYLTEEKANALSVKALYALMFKSGVSTAKEQSEDAGRGVGMDIIYDMARNGQGKIEVNSKPDQFTLMAVNFPIPMNS